MSNTALQNSQISSAGGTACISAINAQPFVGGIPEARKGDQVTVYPHYVELRGHDHYKKNNAYHVTTPSKRGDITEFSRKSANNLKKCIGRTPNLQGMFELTFADDVMSDKTFTERRDYAVNCLRRFKQYLHKKWNIQFVWKREFQDRKSGSLKGDVIPHFHIIFTGLTESRLQNFERVMVQIMSAWVKIMGSEMPKAYKVAINQESYRKIENSRHARIYIGKYFGKVQEHLPEGVSIGRCWGRSQDLPQYEGVRIPINRNESVIFRRFLCRMKRLKKSGNQVLTAQVLNGWDTYLWVGEQDVYRFLDFHGIQTQNVPF